MVSTRVKRLAFRVLLSTQSQRQFRSDLLRRPDNAKQTMRNGELLFPQLTASRDHSFDHTRMFRRAVG